MFGKADGLSVVKITIGDTLTAEDGAKIEISCPATGSPQPKITWLRRGLYFEVFEFQPAFIDLLPWLPNTYALWNSPGYQFTDLKKDGQLG